MFIANWNCNYPEKWLRDINTINLKFQKFTYINSGILCAKILHSMLKS